MVMSAVKSADEWRAGMMREVISGASEGRPRAVRGHPRAIRGHQRRRQRGHQRPSGAIRGHQKAVTCKNPFSSGA